MMLSSVGWCVHQKSVERRLARAGPVAELPVQETVRVPAIQRAGYTITPVASYSLRARVLSTERYWFGREADLSPMDFALGWGPMSDTGILKKVSLSQGGRWYHFRWQEKPPIEPRLMSLTSANTHLIPADDVVRARILGVSAGEIVRIKGYLVNVTAPDGWHWSSSLTREDSGSGSCELMWVTELLVE